MKHPVYMVNFSFSRKYFFFFMFCFLATPVKTKQDFSTQVSDLKQPIPAYKMTIQNFETVNGNEGLNFDSF